MTAADIRLLEGKIPNNSDVADMPDGTADVKLVAFGQGKLNGRVRDVPLDDTALAPDNGNAAGRAVAGNGDGHDITVTFELGTHHGYCEQSPSESCGTHAAERVYLPCTLNHAFS